MIRSSVARVLAAQRLEDGAVLAVDRQQRGAVRARRSPAAGRRRRPGSPCWPAPAPSPCRRRPQPRREAGGADDGRHGPVRPARTPPRPAPPRPAAASMPVPARPPRSSASRVASAVTAMRAPERARLLGQQRHVAGAGQRHDLEGLRPAGVPQQLDGVAADRAGRAEDADPAPHGSGADHAPGRPSAVQSAKNQAPPISASNRSKSPPCPGISGSNP